MFDPKSATKFWPAPPTRFLRFSSESDCCVSVLVSWRAPLGVEATSARLARRAGIAPAMAFCATLRSRPRTEAIFAITSGVRNCITIETRFVAMAILLSKVQLLTQLVRPIRIASPKFDHLILQPLRINPGSTKAATIWELDERRERALMAGDGAR